MKIDGVEIRSLETDEQFFWFLVHKYQKNFQNFSFSGHNRPRLFLSTMACGFSDHGYELILADDKIWAVKPDDDFKETFGLNPAKPGSIQYLRLAQEEGEESNNVLERDIGFYFNFDESLGPHNAFWDAVKLLDKFGLIEHEGERFNKLSVKGKQRYICEVPKLHSMNYERSETSGSSTKNMKYGRGETSGSSTENMNYGQGEVRGHSDWNHTHKNHSASDEAGQKSTEAGQKSYEAAMKQNIDNKKVNDEHVVDMPESPDHSNKKEQANDGPFKLCEIGLANTVSLMGSNPPPWATTPTSQRLLGFSGAANVVGYVGTTAALSLRYTRPRAARIFANIGPIGCAWGVIMGFTSYLPREFQWLGYVAALLCTLAVILANY